MSHETHGTGENKTIISFKNSFWLVVIIVGLFVAALNFIQAQDEGHGEAHGTEMKAHEEHGAGGGHEAEHHAAPAAEHHEDAPPAADSSHGHH
ncbi:MAG: hypothetical protein K0Q79_2428 [Flavipsychrobacter sp.]|jgi:hypothetical protein|nr:hypothetical protein [Flavipsychrobacter sp.]